MNGTSFNYGSTRINAWNSRGVGYYSRGIGSVGGALGSGIGRFLETGDLEEGLKTGATSLIGGKVLGSVFGGGRSTLQRDKAVSYVIGQAI